MSRNPGRSRLQTDYPAPPDLKDAFGYLVEEEREDFLKRVKALAPVDTGRLRDGYHIDGDAVVNEVPYALAVEYTHSPHIRPALHQTLALREQRLRRWVLPLLIPSRRREVRELSKEILPSLNVQPRARPASANRVQMRY